MCEPCLAPREPWQFGLTKLPSQARFDISSGRVDIQRPSSFTVCIQEAPNGTWWMFPSAEGDGWLCAKRRTDPVSHVVK